MPADITRHDLERAAKRFDGWIESDTVGNDICIQVIPPPGFVW